MCRSTVLFKHRQTKIYAAHFRSSVHANFVLVFHMHVFTSWRVLGGENSNFGSRAQLDVIVRMRHACTLYRAPSSSFSALVLETSLETQLVL